MHKILTLIDGENLLLRYQEMLKAGNIPCPDTIHIPNILVWHPKMTTKYTGYYWRVIFFQTMFGDEDAIIEAKKNINSISFNFSIPDSSNTTIWNGCLSPRVFKKQKKGVKTKSVDINLTIEALRNSYRSHCDIIYLISGDGDYLPLVTELMHSGVQVWVGAFSSGLNEHLKYAGDEFEDLDAIFFPNTEEEDAI